MVKIGILDQRLIEELILPTEGPSTQKLSREIIAPAERAFTLLLCDLEDLIRAAAEAGYDGVGLSSSEIERYLGQKHSSEELVSLPDKYQIPVSEVCCIVEWNYEGKARKKAMEDARKIFSYASLLGCSVVDIGLPTHKGNLSLAKRDFGEICKTAADYGLSVALECFGFGTHIKDIKTARIVVEEPANGGINLDTYQFYRGGSTLEDLEDFPVEKILTAHFCDSPRQWTVPGDCWDRPLPGETGVVPIKEIINILKNKGYSGYYSVEAFNYDLCGKDPGEVARTGIKIMKDLLGKNK